VPELGADVATVVSRDATAVDNDGEDDEPDAGGDLDDREDKLDLTVSADAEDLDDRERYQEDGDPDADIDLGASLPIVNRDGSGSDLEGQDSEPLDGII